MSETPEAPDGLDDLHPDRRPEGREGHEQERSRWRRRLTRDRSGADEGEVDEVEREDREVMENFASRLFHQWNQLREERQEQLAVLVPATPRTGRPTVPWGIDLAAQWAWRLLLIVAAGYVLARALGFLGVVVVPLVIALLITALVVPLVAGAERIRIPRPLASLLVVIGGIAFLGLMLTFAGQQVANGANDLADQTVEGLGQIERWLKTGPLNASDSQINDVINTVQASIQSWTAQGDVVGRVTEVGTALTHVFAGAFIVLFATYFFLADGDRIWSWLVRIAPRAARPQVDSSGKVAWISLTQFVRATVVVAAVDAVGIMIVAAILQVPLIAAIGVLVFLGAFIPLVGATVAGTVAVLVALVDQGPVTALLMLGGVVLVQQVEAHALQPFLMGRWVSVHPLAVIVALAVGVLVAGIVGALVSVPLAAAVNAVVLHLSADQTPEEQVQDAEDATPLGNL